jgi:3-hydroxyacyl-[acyl-carrier-protein] dehydratase
VLKKQDLEIQLYPIVNLILKIEAIRSHGRVWKYKGEAFVNEVKMADAIWSATIVDKK